MIGSVLLGGMSFIERHRNKYVECAMTGCWLWCAALSDGYGIVRRGTTMVQAHRLFCEEAKGPCPEGMNCSHLCHVRACVNPSHIVYETHSQNCLRKSEAARKESASIAGKKSYETGHIARLAIARQSRRSLPRYVTLNKRTGKFYVRLSGRYCGSYAELSDAENAANALVPQ